MTHFTKILYLVLALSLLITLASCGGEVSEITDALGQTDAPQADAPQTDAPKTDAPQADAPQTDAPQTDAPHVHSFTDEVTPATCIAEGKIIPKCACGEAGDEVVIPKMAHIAKEVNCDKDTLCGVCGAVIAPATGHKMLVSEVISQATCATSGNVAAICSICGKEENMIAAQTEHSFDSNTKWTVSDGVYRASSGCAFCGTNSISESDTPAFLLDFETPLSNSATKYDGFRIVNPDSYDSKTVEANGSRGLKVVSSSSSIFYIDFDAEKLLELGTASISFDMTLIADGKSGKEPSLFSLLGNFQNGASTGTTKYGWIFKFKTDEGKLETVQGKTLDSTNSIALEKGVKYQVNILFDTESGKADVFVNGKHVGASQNTYAYLKNDSQNQNLSFRFGDGNMPETVFDNIRISAVR